MTSVCATCKWSGRRFSPQPFAPKTFVVAGTGWNWWVNNGASSARGNACRGGARLEWCRKLGTSYAIGGLR
jgi:hypothetical protein